MKRLGVQSAILSVAAPGPLVVSDPDAQAALARRLNEFAARIRDEDHHTFGFFASLPDITNTSAALAEIAHAFDVLGADGVTLFTRYGGNATYLGNPVLEPVWRELDQRGATVFVHPTHGVETDFVNPNVPMPLVDYPHETTRTAVDMIASRTLKKFPNVKVVLSHAGGTLPFLTGRLLNLLAPKQASWWSTATTYDEAKEAVRSFYYDLALSTSKEALRALLEVVPADHVVYGSDFPYAPSAAYPVFLEELEGFGLDREQREQVNFGNAQTLIPRLGKQVEVAEL